MAARLLVRPLPRQVLVAGAGRTLTPGDAPGLPDTYDQVRGRWPQGANTSATSVLGMRFALATHQGAVIEYTLTRGAGVVRTGLLALAGDSAAPSVSDSAAAVGAAGITWSAVVASGVVQVQLAVDNSIPASGIRLVWAARLHLVP